MKLTLTLIGGDEEDPGGQEALQHSFLSAIVTGAILFFILGIVYGEPWVSFEEPVRYSDYYANSTGSGALPDCLAYPTSGSIRRVVTNSIKLQGKYNNAVGSRRKYGENRHTALRRSAEYHRRRSMPQTYGTLHLATPPCVCSKHFVPVDTDRRRSSAQWGFKFGRWRNQPTGRHQLGLTLGVLIWLKSPTGGHCHLTLLL